MAEVDVAEVDRANETIPASVEELDLPTLNRLVRQMHPDATVTGFELVEARQRGEMVSTAGRVKLRLDYGPDSPPLPRDVLIKMCLDDDSAPTVLYETEVKVYQRILPHLAIEKPVCLAAAFDDATGRFALILEDLSVRDARFPNVLQPPLTPAEVGKLLDLQAVLHARYWNSPDLDAEKSWLSSLTEGRQFAFFEQAAPAWIPTYCREIPYRHDLITRVGRSAEHLWENVKAVHAWQERNLPMTFAHGDTGAHNSYHLPDGRCGFLDWQLSVRGHWSHDVHYTVCTALSVADRRAHEKALVERYLGRLKALGVPDVPTLDDAMREFGRAIIWGFTIGWLMVPPTNYPPAIINANLERLYAAVLDHRTLDLADAVTPPLR
ncbi:phosphotransferase [Novosphingobium bradum]|uniref:Phosphotransferase n=1 Tax=Novosphingobium bradum TaxID=1737444 RepID=A0ABV7ILV1_9SPHN